MRIPKVTENTVDPFADINTSLQYADGLIVGFATVSAAPPGSPTDGQRVAVQSGATGAFSGRSGELAVYRATGDYWQFYPAAMCVVAGDIWVSTGSAWVQK